MKKYLHILLLNFVSCFLVAQDIHFSQINETPILYNPAVTGFYEGYEQLTVNERSQWIGGSTKFSTFSLAAEMNFMKKKGKIEKAHVGMGLQMYSDVGGASRMGTRSGAISIAAILPLQVGHLFSVGIQAGFGNRYVDLSRVQFENQWNEDHFDSYLNSGESGSLKGFMYVDATAGIFYSYTSKNKSFIHQRGNRFQVGLSVSHINQPRFSYQGLSGETLYRKYALNTNFSRDFKNRKFGFDLSALVFMQGPHFQEIAGGIVRFNFNGSKVVYGKTNTSYVGIGVFYRFKDALIPRFIFCRKGVKLGISYDINTSLLSKTGSRGTLEFTLQICKLDKSLFRKK